MEGVNCKLNVFLVEANGLNVLGLKVGRRGSGMRLGFVWRGRCNRGCLEFLGTGVNLRALVLPLAFCFGHL